MLIDVNDACTLYSGLQTDVEGPQVLCKECGFSGYLSQGVCQCLSPSMDPNNECFAPGSRNETLVREWTYFNSSCECDHSFEKGFYRLTDENVKKKIINGTEVYQWADGRPPTCYLCFNPYYGPAPSLQTYSAKSLRFPACGQYGGPDPVIIETKAPTFSPSQRTGLGGKGGRRLSEQFIWSSCSGHGVWNNTWNGCQCSKGWGLEVVSLGYNDTIMPTCQICQGPYGPLPPSQQSSLPQEQLDVPFCSVIFTPDPVDGTLRECGGHGSFYNGGCICDQSEDLGWWKLGSYKMNETTLFLSGKETYNETVIEYEVMTCQECLVGELPCMSSASPSLNPTESPTA
jgi:hypothetical protein